jgi:hypothetical protein
MGSFELNVGYERFQVSDRRGLGGRISYDFSWLNGPAEGTYGFTVGLSAAPSVIDTAQMSEQQLVEVARNFIETFYGVDGISEADFPEHTRAGPPKL